jgi:uncharacterized membrane protein YfcA
MPPAILTLLALAGVWAGVQNALAGGGSFITFPVLLAAGLDARAANITSTIALFPGQVTIGYAGRALAGDAPQLSLRWLSAISLVGGVMGAILLLATPPGIFARLVPFFVAFATLVFAWGNFFRRHRDVAPRMKRWQAAAAQGAISIYGGYFGGGIGILMLAALTLAGMDVRRAAGTKNVLAAVMNLSAVVIFAFSPDVHWLAALTMALGAIAGGRLGAMLLTRINPMILKYVVVIIGGLLTVGLFYRAY